MGGAYSAVFHLDYLGQEARVHCEAYITRKGLPGLVKPWGSLSLLSAADLVDQSPSQHSGSLEIAVEPLCEIHGLQKPYYTQGYVGKAVSPPNWGTLTTS